VQKSHTDQIFVKYNFGDDEFVAINVRRAQRGRPGTAYKMPMMYEEKLPISVAKKRDLMCFFFKHTSYLKFTGHTMKSAHKQNSKRSFAMR
jgi:hypothetical protein